MWVLLGKLAAGSDSLQKNKTDKVHDETIGRNVETMQANAHKTLRSLKDLLHDLHDMTPSAAPLTHHMPLSPETLLVNRSHIPTNVSSYSRVNACALILHSQPNCTAHLNKSTSRRSCAHRNHSPRRPHAHACPEHSKRLMRTSVEKHAAKQAALSSEVQNVYISTHASGGAQSSAI